MADISELTAAFQAAVSVSGVTTLLYSSGSVSERFPQSAVNLPCVTWYVLHEDAQNRMNANTDKSVEIVINVSAWSPEIPAVGSGTGETGNERNRRICGTIDTALVDKPQAAAWATTNWRILHLRRTSGWKEITGDEILFQRTADFTMKAVRKS